MAKNKTTIQFDGDLSRLVAKVKQAAQAIQRELKTALTSGGTRVVDPARVDADLAALKSKYIKTLNEIKRAASKGKGGDVTRVSQLTGGYKQAAQEAKQAFDAASRASKTLKGYATADAKTVAQAFRASGQTVVGSFAEIRDAIQTMRAAIKAAGSDEKAVLAELKRAYETLEKLRLQITGAKIRDSKQLIQQTRGEIRVEMKERQEALKRQEQASARKRQLAEEERRHRAAIMQQQLSEEKQAFAAYVAEARRAYSEARAILKQGGPGAAHRAGAVVGGQQLDDAATARLFAQQRIRESNLTSGQKDIELKKLETRWKRLNMLVEQYERELNEVATTSQAASNAQEQDLAAVEGRTIRVAQAIESMGDENAEAVKYVTLLGEAWESVEHDIRNTKTMANVFTGELKTDGRIAMQSLSTEWDGVLQDIMRANGDLTQMSDTTKRWLGILQQGNTMLDKFRGTVPKAASGRKANMYQQRAMNPTGYQAGQFVFQSARIAQDAPFGLLGIANNMDMFIHAFRSMKAAAKETGASIRKELGGALKSTWGLMLGMNIATSLMIGWPKIEKGFKWLMEQFGGMRDLSKEIRKNMIEGVGSNAKFSSGLVASKAEYESATTYLKALSDERKAIQAEGRQRQMVDGRPAQLMVQSEGAFGPYGALTEEERARVERLNEDIKAQGEIQKKAAENYAAEMAKIRYAALAQDQAVRNRFFRDERESLGKHIKEQIEIRKSLGESVEDLEKEQNRLVNELRAEALEEQAASYRAMYEETGAEIFAIISATATRNAIFIRQNLDHVFGSGKDETKKQGKDYNRVIEDILAESRQIMLQSVEQTHAIRLRLIAENRAAEMVALDRELEDFEGSAGMRERLAEALGRKRAAINQKYNREIEEEDKRHADDMLQRARQRLDVQLETANASLSLMLGNAGRIAQARADHEAKVRELEQRIEDERRKSSNEQTEGLIGDLQERIDAEGRVFDIRMDRLQKEIDRQKEQASLEIEAGRRTLAQRQEMFDIEQRIFAAREAKAGGILGLSPMNIQESLEGKLLRQEGTQKFAADQTIAAFESRVKSLRDTIADLEGDGTADHAAQIADLNAQIRAIEEQHQLEMTLMTAEGEAERLRIISEHAAAKRDLMFSTIEEILGGFSGIAQQTTSVWENRRRRELAAEGKTQQQMNRIIQQEGKKRFAIYQAIAIAETTVATYAAAQKMAEATAHLGPVLQAAAVAAQIAAGLARVQQIRAQRIGGSISGDGGGGTSLLGAVETAGSSSGSASGYAPQGSVAGKNSGQAFIDFVERSPRINLSDVELANISDRLEQIARINSQGFGDVANRPVSVTIGDEAQGAIVRGGDAFNQRRTR